KSQVPVSQSDLEAVDRPLIKGQLNSLRNNHIPSKSCNLQEQTPIGQPAIESSLTCTQSTQPELYQNQPWSSAKTKFSKHASQAGHDEVNLSQHLDTSLSLKNGFAKTSNLEFKEMNMNARGVEQHFNNDNING